jgi:putative transposase
MAGGAVPADTAASLGAGVWCQPGHVVAVASPAGRLEVEVSRAAPGRPSTPTSISRLVVAMARQNPGWGHRRIQGELDRPGHEIAYSTVWEILKKAGIDPAPQRSGPTWREFLSAQAHRIIACDFLHVDTVLLLRL